MVLYAWVSAALLALPSRAVPGALGVQSGECFAALRDGIHVVHGGRYRSRFVFDRDYALEVWSLSDGGGRGAYKRYGSTWCVITRGGGAFGEADLVKYNDVPAPVAHRFFAKLDRTGGDHR